MPEKIPDVLSQENKEKTMQEEVMESILKKQKRHQKRAR
jgi:hypothetical protein